MRFLIQSSTMVRRSALLAGAAALLLTLPTMPRAGRVLAASPAATIVHVLGQTTRWDLSLTAIRSMYRIPHTTWRGYRANFYRIFVMAVRLTNTGRRAAAPYGDLTLTLKVTPPATSSYIAGFTSVPPTGPFVAMMRTAAREYGGVVPTTVTQPGHTTTYTYIIATNRGDHHYGLFNSPPYKASVYLLDTGL